MKIKANGDLEFLGFPPKGINVTIDEVRRFSEIVPDCIHPWKARAFRLLRLVFGERGRVAAWTRTWRCQWVCTILRGPMRGSRQVSTNRQLLVDWEQRVWMTTAPIGSEREWEPCTPDVRAIDNSSRIVLADLKTTFRGRGAKR